MQVNPPRGMRDFLPADKQLRETVLDRIKNSYRQQGFSEIETPALEEYTTLTSGNGGDNEKMMFNILRRRLNEEDIKSATTTGDLVDMGMRYDLTVPLARFYKTNVGVLPKRFKSFQIGPVWRGERPQKGRYRQFIQCDLDIIGDPSVLAEGELLTTASATLKNLGITDFKIKVNSRGLLNYLLNKSGVTEELVASTLITIDKFEKIGAAKVSQEFKEAGLSDETQDMLNDFFGKYIPGEKNIVTALQEIKNDFPALPTDDLTQLAEALDDDTSSRLIFDPLLVRGMGYYTGLIYEIITPSVDYSIGGGGRYDNMLSTNGKDQTPAVGISLGFERLLNLVNLTTPESSGLVILYDKEIPSKDVLTLKQHLIDQAYKVTIAPRPRNTTNLLNTLAKEGYTQFINLQQNTDMSAPEIRKINPA